MGKMVINLFLSSLLSTSISTAVASTQWQCEEEKSYKFVRENFWNTCWTFSHAFMKSFVAWSMKLLFKHFPNFLFLLRIFLKTFVHTWNCNWKFPKWSIDGKNSSKREECELYKNTSHILMLLLIFTLIKSP